MNEKPASHAKNALNSLRFLRPRLFVISLLIGVVSGIIISLYRIGIRLVSSLMLTLVEKGHANTGMALLALLAFAGLGLLSAYILKKEPDITGSGIPQITAELSGKLTTRWYTVLPLKFLGGLVSLGSGLTLGREGPSVQIGGAVGNGVGALLKRPQSEKNYLMTGGAAAGLAAAFNAPVSGVVFALEELHHHFSPRVLLSAMTAAFVSDFVGVNIFGLQPVLSFSGVTTMPLNQYFSLILLGIAVGLSGILFSKGILFAKKLYAKVPEKLSFLRGLIPFLVTCAALLYSPRLFGSGEEMIFLPVHGNLPPLDLLLSYLVKLMLVLIAFGSGIAGGIFFPLLVLGSLAGNLLAQAFSMLGLISPDMVLTLSLLAMAGHFAAIVRSPLTGILLIAEMTGSFAFMLPLGIVCLTAYMAAEALSVPPIYESLTELLTHKAKTEPEKEKDSGRQVREYAVFEGSPAARKKINELRFPAGLLIVSVLRGKEELSPLPGLTLMPGDYLFVLGTSSALVKHEAELKSLLEG